jgi:hypothetical protein
MSMNFTPAACELTELPDGRVLARVTTTAGNVLTVHLLDATKIAEFRAMAAHLHPQPAALRLSWSQRAARWVRAIIGR